MLESFGRLAFGDAEMRRRLEPDAYRALRDATDRGEPMSPEVADAVAGAMRDWAIEHGATHFTHWFQPMTGVTAEKHDGFLEPDGEGGAILRFSGKSLIKGESDASSLPSGGLRATFEARGYTAWDPTSHAFIKDGSLCVPTAFYSYGGDALDKKTPLLRSMEAIDRQAMRILRLFGNREATRVIPQIGPEQEYFLIDREVYLRRQDLILTGRTLFGAKPPKGQEMEDHYCGAIHRRVSEFMKELDARLWELGVFAKTKHNETAPAQHELAPVYSTANVAVDHNQLTMELMRGIAPRHGLACLLHEKPFEGVNGSGKHTNWSLATDSGANLFDPGDTPRENVQFLLFLCAAVQAVDEYQGLLRLSGASAGNDRRLGGDEAPPAIVSVFLGEELTAILESIERGESYVERAAATMGGGARVLPNFPKDATDRNRTAPVAFTGDKFEFRMPGSGFSVSCPAYILNTIVAESLRRYADELESSGEGFAEAALKLIRRSYAAHKRIVFNGNGYGEEWTAEAARRGLLNRKTTPEALKGLIEPANVELFVRHGVLSEREARSRYEILTENYYKTIRIEAATMIDMANRFAIPAALAFQGELARLVAAKRALGLGAADPASEGEARPRSAEERLLFKISELADSADANRIALEAEARAFQAADFGEGAQAASERVLDAMERLREAVDGLESIVGARHWPLPTYAEMLFSVI